MPCVCGGGAESADIICLLSLPNIIIQCVEECADDSDQLRAVTQMVLAQIFICTITLVHTANILQVQKHYIFQTCRDGSTQNTTGTTCRYREAVWGKAG